MTLPDETLIAVQKPYDTGYINGYLEVLSRTYNKRFVHPDDFRLLSAFFSYQQASGDLSADIITALQEQGILHTGAFISSEKPVTLTPLTDSSVSTLEIIVQPWLPPDEAEDLLLLIKSRIAGDFKKYNCWLVNADPAEKPDVSYVSSNLLVLEHENEVLILGFIISNHYL